MPGLDYLIVYTGPTDEKAMVKESGFINGGMKKKSSSANSPVIVVDVEDIDKTIEDVVNSGGKVVSEKMKVQDMGYTAYFQDPEGNVMGLWQNIKKIE